MSLKSIIHKINNTSLRTKIIVPFLLVVLVPMILLAFSSERLIATRVRDEIEKALAQNLEAAWIQYYVRGDQMKFGMLQATEVVEKAIQRKDSNFLRERMKVWKNKRPYVDIWVIVDNEGRVIARLNNKNSGDLFTLNGIVRKAFKSGRPVISTEVISWNMLLKEGKEIAESALVPVVREEKHQGKSLLKDGLMLTVVVPVKDIKDTEKVIGAVITGDILNNDNFVPDTIAAKIPGTLASITLGDVRISTTIPTDSGNRAIGTTLPVNIMTAIQRGNIYKGMLSISKNKYITSFSPIKDNKGVTIGTLSVALPEEKFIALHKSNRQNILTITVVGIIFAIVTATFVTTKLTTPLVILARKTKEAASGNMDIYIPVDDASTRDEVSMLARSFKEMLIEIQRRNRDRELYLQELERKTNELKVLNEKLQATNQELEVSLEEAQSQHEELQSANEELTILNEELEKKTNELFTANMTILSEEEELRKTRDQLQLIFHGIKDYIFLLDPYCTILDVNDSFLKAYNLKRDNVIGQKLYTLLYGYNEVNPACANIASYTSGEPYRELVKQDKKELERYVFPVYDNERNLVNRIEYIRDVTVESKLREQLFQAEKLSSLGEILSGVTHELNNPLTGIIGYCELIRETTKDEKLKDQLHRIDDAAIRCKKIIENLLSFAREKKIERQYSSINYLIKQTLELKTYQLRIDNIEVILDLCENLPYTMVDPYAIQQVFLNIINNAHLSMIEKGGKGKLFIRSEYTDRGIHILFTDTGVGIPEQNLKRIFDPFFTTREVGKGTGLGLSISYGIIKEHNGDIYVESAPGEGSTFIVELPIVSPDAIIGTDRQKDEDVSGVQRKKKNILIVDDEISLLELMEAILSPSGYEIETLSDSTRAIERVMEKDYDLIICDMKMPGMGGRDLYKIIEERRPNLKEKIVFITGDIVNTETLNFLESSSCKYITKPFTPSELRKFVFKILGIEI